MKTVYFLESNSQLMFYRTFDGREQRRRDEDLVDDYQIDDEEFDNWRFEEDR